jgi:hypothetical protein
MNRELKKLAQYAREHGIRPSFMMTPDVHDLLDYKFQFVHDIMRKIAQQDGYYLCRSPACYVGPSTGGNLGNAGRPASECGSP